MLSRLIQIVNFICSTVLLWFCLIFWSWFSLPLPVRPAPCWVEHKNATPLLIMVLIIGLISHKNYERIDIADVLNSLPFIRKKKHISRLPVYHCRHVGVETAVNRFLLVSHGRFTGKTPQSKTMSSCFRFLLYVTLQISRNTINMTQFWYLKCNIL